MYTENAKIRVIGLGGGGNNAINRMIEAKLHGVEFIAANTDAQILADNLAEHRIQIGDHLTKGLGAGADPSIGEKAAEEDSDRIAEALRGSDLVFITAGMGGGTGTGSAPVVAEIAREQGALTIAVVTTPFRFEGPKRMKKADEGVSKLEDKVDALIVVENERLFSILDKKTSVKDAFQLVDRVLHHGVKGISDVINIPGLINVDFADVRAHLSAAGTVVMGIGSGSGENVVEDAANSAINSPLLSRSIKGARQLLINVSGSENISLFETNEIVERISEATETKEPDVIFGMTHDNSLGEEVRVTVIASGFEEQIRTQPLRPSRIRAVAGSRNYDQDDIDIPAFLRYNPKD